MRARRRTLLPLPARPFQVRPVVSCGSGGVVVGERVADAAHGVAGLERDAEGDPADGVDEPEQLGGAVSAGSGGGKVSMGLLLVTSGGDQGTVRSANSGRSRLLLISGWSREWSRKAGYRRPRRATGSVGATGRAELAGAEGGGEARAATGALGVKSPSDTTYSQVRRLITVLTARLCQRRANARPEDDPGDPGSGVAVWALGDVAVDVEGDRDSRMAEAFLHHLRVLTRRQRPRIRCASAKISLSMIGGWTGWSDQTHSARRFQRSLETWPRRRGVASVSEMATTGEGDQLGGRDGRGRPRRALPPAVRLRRPRPGAGRGRPGTSR